MASDQAQNNQASENSRSGNSRSNNINNNNNNNTRSNTHSNNKNNQSNNNHNNNNHHQNNYHHQQQLLQSLSKSSLGLAIKVTVNPAPQSSSSTVFSGRLFAFDTFSGLLVLQSASSTSQSTVNKEQEKPSPESSPAPASVSSSEPQTPKSWASAVSKTISPGQSLPKSTLSGPIEYEQEIPILENQSYNNNVGLVDFHVITITQISNVERLPLEQAKIHPPLISLHPIQVDKLNIREQQGIKLLQEQIKRVGVDVTEEGQRIFDELYKTQPQIKWKGKSIIIMDEIEINPSNNYSIEDVKYIGKDGKSNTSELFVERIKKVLTGVRTKLNI